MIRGPRRNDYPVRTRGRDGVTHRQRRRLGLGHPLRPLWGLDVFEFDRSSNPLFEFAERTMQEFPVLMGIPAQLLQAPRSSVAESKSALVDYQFVVDGATERWTLAGVAWPGGSVSVETEDKQ